MPATVLAAHENQVAYLSDYALREKELPGDGRIRDLRRAAIERFAALGFPTTKNENWKYTNLAPWLKTQYESARSSGPFGWGGDRATAALVFINGRFVPELSRAPAGVKAGSLRDALDIAPVGRYAAFDDNAMAALNTAMFEDGAYVEIRDGEVLDEPLYLVFATLADGAPQVRYPRNVIVAGRNAQARIVEQYLGEGDQPYFTNAVTELVAGEGAIIEHYKLQMEGDRALHFGLLAAEQGRSSSFTSHNIALGAGLARNEIAAVLNGEGAECVLNGLYVTRGTQHIDNYTTLDHAQPHSTSHELYKGVLDGKSQGVFHGRIIVRPEAQKTDAIQRNKNLLLSRDAVINTKPQLEIYADDVKCTHGATVGQVDQDAVFYLRSRGIPLKEARSLLTFAFTADLVELIKVEAIREQIRKLLFARLSQAGI